MKYLEKRHAHEEGEDGDDEDDVVSSPLQLPMSSYSPGKVHVFIFLCCDVIGWFLLTVFLKI